MTRHKPPKLEHFFRKLSIAQRNAVSSYQNIRVPNGESVLLGRGHTNRSGRVDPGMDLGQTLNNPFGDITDATVTQSPRNSQDQDRGRTRRSCELQSMKNRSKHSGRKQKEARACGFSPTGRDLSDDYREDNSSSQSQSGDEEDEDQNPLNDHLTEAKKIQMSKSGVPSDLPAELRNQQTVTFSGDATNPGN